MNREEIENRIYICEKRANSYREVGNTKVAEKYDTEKYKWEKLLSNLDLLEEKKINELLNYKKGYYNQKDVIDKINNYIDNYDVFKVFSFPLMKKWEENQVKSSIDYEFKTSLIKDLKDILKEVSE